MSKFSDFIRNATPEEKEAVYTEVMKKASERQRVSYGDDPFNCPKCGAHDYGLWAPQIGACPWCLKKDSERWQAGKRLGFPQFCGHDSSQRSGFCWYVELKDDNDPYQTADEAMDAAIKNNPLIEGVS